MSDLYEFSPSGGGGLVTINLAHVEGFNRHNCYPDETRVLLISGKSYLLRQSDADAIRAALSAPAPSQGIGREEIARVAWETARALSLADGEDDSGPWPPTAGAFGWQEDDSEMCRETELAKADAILALLEPR